MRHTSLKRPKTNIPFVLKPSQMERYTVTVRQEGSEQQHDVHLLIPFRPTAKVDSFITEIVTRSARQSCQIDLTTHHVTLHLDEPEGPILDVNDILSDVVLDPRSEKIFACFTRKTDRVQPGNTASSTRHPTGPGQDSTRVIPIRVLTPESARSCRNHGGQPVPVPSLTVPASRTIQQLHDEIVKHLQITNLTAPFETDQQTCNCTFAKQIANNFPNKQTGTASNSIIVVHVPCKDRP